MFEIIHRYDSYNIEHKYKRVTEEYDNNLNLINIPKEPVDYSRGAQFKNR